MIYDKYDQERIIQLFETFNNEEVVYVVPRGHTGLPEQTPGGDIDVIVREDHFDRAVDIVTEMGFAAKSSRLSELSNLGGKAVSDPIHALTYIACSPVNAISLVADKITGAVERSEHRYVTDWKGWNGDVMIHLRNHLAYTSPWEGGQFRVDPMVESDLFEYRRTSDTVSVPAPSDELAHLICRALFDKRGAFPDYYVDRCETLVHERDAGGSNRFERLLSMLFFDADELVYNHVVEGEYDSLLNDLRSFSDY